MKKDTKDLLLSTLILLIFILVGWSAVLMRSIEKTTDKHLDVTLEEVRNKIRMMRMEIVRKELDFMELSAASQRLETACSTLNYQVDILTQQVLEKVAK